jgi:8-oxo-dGTP diphosphatase
VSQRNPHRKYVDAAGAVLWRSTDRGIDIALIHRPRYDDWSLPKGKVDPGETAVVAAVREIHEETGVRARLGRHLTRVSYPMTGNRTKRVHYWAARAQAGAGEPFVPNDEVDQLRWLSVDQAAGLLTYDADRAVLKAFARLPAETRTLLLVRHAKAGSRATYQGEDRERPLDAAGLAQARALVPNLAAFGARFVHSADPVRCRQTVEPAAEFLGTDVVIEPAMSESAYAADPYAADVALRGIAALDDVRVVCSQGKVIPGLLRGLADRDGMPLPARATRKASCWVLSLYEDRFVAADYLSSPLPRR